jgi:hypothetical protein
MKVEGRLSPWKGSAAYEELRSHQERSRCKEGSHCGLDEEE